MCILSDREIIREMAAGRLGIEPFREENLTPNGYDVTIGEIVIPEEDMRTISGAIRIPPLTRFAVGTLEFFRFPTHISGQIWIRTTWARRGVIGGFGKIDAGYRGTLTLMGFNSSRKEVEMRVGDTFAQVIFIKMCSSAEKEYGERSGNYLDSRGVVLER